MGDSWLYALTLHMKYITACTGIGGVTITTYKRALDHVPATQLYGLIIKTLVLTRVNRKRDSVGASMLNVIEYVLEASDSIVEVQPALPYKHEADNAMQKLMYALPDETASRLQRALGVAPVLKGLVDVPKPIARHVGRQCRRNGVDLQAVGTIGLKLPLATIIVAPLASMSAKGCKALKEVYKASSLLKGRRFRAGIAYDRVRKAAAYGMFYAYQYTYLSTNRFVSCFTIRRPINYKPVVEAMKALGLGFKKSVNMVVEEANVMLSGADITVKELLADIAVATLHDMQSLYTDKLRLLLLAYDTSILAHEMFKGKLIETRIRPVPYVYLELFNRFYMLASQDCGQYRHVTLASAGSSFTLDYSNNVEALEEEVAAISSPKLLSRLTVLVSPLGVAKARSSEQRLVLSKVRKALLNYAPIIMPGGGLMR